jgi:Uma2 family endonuclease
MPRQTAPEAPPTAADLLERIERLGGIAPRRVVLQPLPGTATEADLERLLRTDRLFELVDGTLVEKVMGAPEANLAGWILTFLNIFCMDNKLGVSFCPDGTFRLMAGLVRMPDVTFIRREKLPGGRIPRKPILDLAPDLAVEVLSESNTRGEMQRKLKEYFLAGTTLVWLVDPDKRTVAVHTAPDVSRTLTEADTLDGGDVLPGLQLPVRRIFEDLAPGQPPRRSRRKKPGA